MVSEHDGAPPQPPVSATPAPGSQQAPQPAPNAVPSHQQQQHPMTAPTPPPLNPRTSAAMEIGANPAVLAPPLMAPLAPVAIDSIGAVDGVSNGATTAVNGMHSNNSDFSGVHTPAQQLKRRYNVFLDQITPLTLYRWLALVVLVLVFSLRILLVQGFYIVAYVLFIFLLNQFILFLQPKDRASLMDPAESSNGGGGASGGGDALPTTIDFDTYRPFYRKLPEFKFWHSAFKATFTALVCTFIPFCDVPVFWPILVVYSVLLFIATMRRQFMDMKRFKYVPWDIGNKKKYAGTAKSVASTESNAPASSGAQPAPAPPKPSRSTKPKSDS